MFLNLQSDKPDKIDTRTGTIIIIPVLGIRRNVNYVLVTALTARRKNIFLAILRVIVNSSTRYEGGLKSFRPQHEDSSTRK